MPRATDELVKIATAGGGMILSAKDRTVDDLVRIAAAAQAHRAHITLLGVEALQEVELMRIGAAGAGTVVFDFRETESR